MPTRWGEAGELEELIRQKLQNSIQFVHVIIEGMSRPSIDHHLFHSSVLKQSGLRVGHGGRACP
jgi:hypothetical protein